MPDISGSLGRVNGQAHVKHTLDCRCFNSWRSKLPSRVITPAGCCHLVCCARTSQCIFVLVRRSVKEISTFDRNFWRFCHVQADLLISRCIRGTIAPDSVPGGGLCPPRYSRTAPCPVLLRGLPTDGRRSMLALPVKILFTLLNGLQFHRCISKC